MNPPDEALTPLKFEKHPGLILGLLAFGAFALKSWLLWKRSIYIDPDEGYYLLLARNILLGNGYTMNGLPNIVFPPFLPLIIAAFNFFIDNLQISLGLITSLSGTLLGLVGYKLAREWLPVRYALLYAFLVFFIPPLNAFIPTSATYVHTLYRGSDILNSLLILLQLYLVLRMVRTGKIIYAFSAGLVAAFSYLARPEGFILWGILLMALMALKLAKRGLLPFKLIVSYALVFILLSAPYVIFLKNITGQWALSGKYALSRDYRDSLIKVIKNEDWGDFRKIHYKFNSSLMEMNDYYFGYYPGSPQGKSESPQPFSDIFANLSLSPVVPKVLFPYPLIPFFLIGLAASLSRMIKKGPDAEIIIGSAFLYSFFLAGLSYPMPRHHLFLVPVFCFYAVQGILLASRFLAKFSSSGIVTLLFIGLFCWVFVTDYSLSIRKSLLTSGDFLTTALAEGDIARYLKDHNSLVVMTLYPAIAIKSSSDWQVLPNASLSTQIRFALKKHVDHMILSGDKRYFYKIIDIKNSTISEDMGEEIKFQTIESLPRFEVVQLIDTGTR